jgi:hypothetical protein
VRTLRTHHGVDDAAFNAALLMEDEECNLGVALTKDLVRVAGAALRRHITTLGPQVLPVSEMLHDPAAAEKGLEPVPGYIYRSKLNEMNANTR